MSDSFHDSDPGELDPERLARLRELLLEAVPPAATAGEWDDTFAQVFGSDDAGLADLDVGGLVPDQNLWTDDAGELSGWGDDADSDTSDDGGWRGAEWSAGDSRPAGEGIDDELDDIDEESDDDDNIGL